LCARLSRSPSLNLSVVFRAGSQKNDFAGIVTANLAKSSGQNWGYLCWFCQQSTADDEMDSLLNQKQAAQVLGISVRTLERHRVAGTGPRWARLGRLVRYRESDLVEWIERNLRSSTSETVFASG
jgi:predicted DNA-binding transcriptional regulator AlpA